MIDNPGWHTCDWCGNIKRDEDFHYTGILDICTMCVTRLSGGLVDTIMDRLIEAKRALDYVHDHTTFRRCRCESCGTELAKLLCPICSPGAAWRPFPETQPGPLDGRVLVYTAANNQHVARWDGKQWLTLHGNKIDVVTHWQPLLPPEDCGPYFTAYSGFTTGSPINIVARNGPVFRVHAENGEEVQRLVAYLNEQHRKGQGDE